MNFWSAGAALNLPDPEEYESSFPAETETTLTQGGFFIPLSAPDDVEAVVSATFKELTEQQLAALQQMRSPAVFTFSDPLDLYMQGYFKSLDSQTVDGRVAPDGGPMYQVQVSIQVLNLSWPDVMGMFEPNSEYSPGTAFGISASGQQPASFTGQKETLTDLQGWAVCTGGDTEPWGPVVPPTRDGEWDRSIRQRIPPVHGVVSNYLALDSTQLTPTRGSVFLAFKPIST